MEYEGINYEKEMSTAFEEGKTYKTVGGWDAKVVYIKHTLRSVPIVGVVEDLELTVVHKDVPTTSRLCSADGENIIQELRELVLQHQWDGELMDMSFENALNYTLRLDNEA